MEVKNTRRTLKEQRRKRLTIRPRIINELKPYDQRAYYHYNRAVKQERNVINNTRGSFTKSVKSIYEAIQEIMVENDTGVFLKEYGYFTAMILAELGGSVSNNIKIHKKEDTEVYSLQLFTDIGTTSVIKGMAMEGAFSKETRGKFHRAIYAGLRPKLYYTTLFNMYSRRRIKL